MRQYALQRERVFIRDCFEFGSWDIGPVILVVVWDDKRSASCNEVDGAIVVVMMMMRNLQRDQDEQGDAEIGPLSDIPRDGIWVS